MLAELQSHVQAVIRDGAAPGAAFTGNPHGVAAYRHAYTARLVEALQDNYAALHQALGDEAFASVAHAYLRAHPPTEPSIRTFGHALPAFLDAWPALPHPALADLARLDWALRHAFDAEALPTLSATDLADPERWAHRALRLQPHVCVLPLRWAVGPTWHALQAAREAGLETELPAPTACEHTALTWRSGLSPQWRSLDDAEAQALRSAQAQPHATAWLEAQGEARLADAVGWLRRWVDDGLLRLASAPQ